MFICRAMGINVKRWLYEGITAPTALYCAETLNMAVAGTR